MNLSNEPGSLPSEPPSGNSETKAYLNFDLIAHEYDTTRYLPPEVVARIVVVLREAAGLASGQVLLDAGVGTGRLALPLARSGVSMVGVDISEKMLAQLQTKRAEERPVTLRLVRGDLRHLPFASNVFGATLIMHILHLITDWQQVLSEVRRVLIPGRPLLMAWENGRHSPTRETYFAQARARGVWRPHIGATNSEEVMAYLRGEGADVRRVDEDGVHWKTRARVGDILEALRRRTWSNLWGIPDDAHAEIMAATEAWAGQTYDSLDSIEEADAMLMVWAVRW